jgi:outer membrane protein assembly factor BamE
MNRALALAVPLLVTACSYLPEMPSLPSLTSIKPYRIDIQQGNFLSPEMVAQLKKGMTREQVRFVLGTPLVTDIFHADRWDYVFYRELGNGTKERKSLAVFFENDRLARAVGDDLPLGLADTAAGKEEAKN